MHIVWTDMNGNNYISYDNGLSAKTGQTILVTECDGLGLNIIGDKWCQVVDDHEMILDDNIVEYDDRIIKQVK